MQLLIRCRAPPKPLSFMNKIYQSNPLTIIIYYFHPCLLASSNLFIATKSSPAANHLIPPGEPSSKLSSWRAVTEDLCGVFLKESCQLGALTSGAGTQTRGQDEEGRVPSLLPGLGGLLRGKGSCRGRVRKDPSAIPKYHRG